LIAEFRNLLRAISSRQQLFPDKCQIRRHLKKR
jgi:hypothetical protein